MSVITVKKERKKRIRVSRYNNDLYMLFGNEDYYSASMTDEKCQQQLGHHYEFRNKVFSESLYYDPNKNEPDRSLPSGVHHSSFGEFEMIYPGFLYGIQAEEEFNDFDDLEALNACRWVIADVVTDNNNSNNNNYDDDDDDNRLNYLDFWLNAYLSNVKDIYVAYINSNGIVNKPVVHKHISELPKNALWKPRICTGFLYKFLQEVNTLMSNDNVNSLNTVYEFSINADNTVTYKIFKNKPEKFGGPPEYMEYCKK
ncbi:hypothetical protein DOY81_013715 [Sarcophaga bullata]|nr:hypothetical protein DOY81_013715 [Sarcophaga bullata]